MKIAIAVARGVPLEVEAHVTGQWAVHANPFADHANPFADHCWTVTHIPTGLRIPRDLSLRRANELANRLSRDVPTLPVEVRVWVGQPTIDDMGADYVGVLDILNQIVREMCP